MVDIGEIMEGLASGLITNILLVILVIYIVRIYERIDTLARIKYKEHFGYPPSF